MGWHLSRHQKKKLLSITGKVALFLDNDETGWEALRKIHKRLIYRAMVRVLLYPSGLPDKTQPEHSAKEEIKRIFEGKHVVLEGD
ncbi:hypothetical protein JXJ21_08390 [candidate division KSB1 bacterium]|nr:hypothetical protein [candidate division KSB1 bacterium]